MSYCIKGYACFVYCDPTTQTHTTIVWHPEDTSATFQVAKIHARMIKFHQKYFLRSIPFDKTNQIKLTKNLNQIKPTKLKYIDGIENKLTRFQIYPETAEVASNYPKPFQNTIFRNSCRIRLKVTT